MIDCAAVKKLKEIVSHRKKDEKTEKIPSPIAEKEDEQDEDDCSAKPCLKPLGSFFNICFFMKIFDFFKVWRKEFSILRSLPFRRRS